MEQRTPVALSQLMRIEGLGSKRVKTLYEALGIQSLDDLKQAVDARQVRGLSGFGAKTEDKIRQGIERLAGSAARTKLIHAEQIAAPLVVAWLKESKGVKDVEVAGSFRRRKETVGDLDILVTASRNSDVMQRFVRYGEAEETVSQGKTRSTLRLRSGLQADLRVVPQVAFGAALYYFTGSKDHNIAVRKLAQKKKLKINEYGVFKGDERVAGRTEKEVFDSVDLPFIPPELRENRGEIEAAARENCPSWSSSTRSAATCTATPTPPTAIMAWSRWPARRRRWAMNTWPSATTAGMSVSPAGWTENGWKRRSRPSIASTGSGMDSSSSSRPRWTFWKTAASTCRTRS
ncbi:MAG: helix-hairpin-helix domain-containing protein [Thiobacillus sp.]